MTVEIKPGENPAPVDYEKPDEDEVAIHVPRKNIERAVIAILALIGAGGGSFALHDKIAQPSNNEVTQDFRHLHDVLEGKVESYASTDMQRYQKVQDEILVLRHDMAECRKNILDYLMQHRSADSPRSQDIPGIAEMLK